jgi:predicted permease
VRPFGFRRARSAERDLDEEIRGHLAISVKERIDGGDDPESARRAALLEFGYVPSVRDAVHRVWYGRWFDAIASFLGEMRIGLRSLVRSKGLAVTVVATLALGIGANAAIFSVVRGVLLRPLVNRGEDQLIYIQQSAPGFGVANATFSVPEIADIKARAKTIAAFGDFSTVDFTLVGLGDPQIVKAGVVSGAYFDVMGLCPEIGRLLDEEDDGPKAPGAIVLTHRFWSTTLKSDASVVGKTVKLGALDAKIVGVLEPSLPYPSDTEIIANVVTSPHHLEATMKTLRTHRMTNLFGRLAPGASVQDARRELTSIHAAMLREHPDAYAAKADMQISVSLLRDQITAPARPILILLLTAAAVVFIIACSNVANLILARSVRRESELSVRAALGASRGALRRTLLAESLVLCGAGAAFGVLLARPFVAIVAQYASRFSVRALDVTVDASVLWVGVLLAIGAAVLLAHIPRLPSTEGGRLKGSPNRRLRVFAVTQIACSFVLLATAAALVTALVALKEIRTGYDLRNVLAVDLPTASLSMNRQEISFYRDLTQRVGKLPGVTGVSMGMVVPWRDSGKLPGLPFAIGDEPLRSNLDNPRAWIRMISPGFFSVVGVPLLSGRDFTDEDGTSSEPVVIVSKSVADQLVPNGDALNHKVAWTDPLFDKTPRRIVGIVADVDDEHIVPGPALTIYHPIQQVMVAGRLFVHVAGDPYAVVPALKKIVRRLSADQPIEHAATLEDVRATVLAPKHINAEVASGFAGIALVIAVVGVAGVLAFSVKARMREFGVRLALGSSPRRLLVGVLLEGVVIVTAGILAGAIVGYAASNVAFRYVDNVQLPGVVPTVTAALLLAAAAVLASLVPAARAARVDVLQALRSE